MAEGKIHILIAPIKIINTQAAGIVAATGAGRQLQNGRELGFHQVAAHLVGPIGEAAGMAAIGGAQQQGCRIDGPGG